MKKLFTLLLIVFCSVPLMAKEKPVLKIVITTDIHAQWNVLENVYAFMAKKNPDVVLFAGDLARYVGDAKSYKTYIDIYNKHFSKCDPKPVHIPIAGNHDYWEYKGVKRLAPQDSLKRFFHPMGMKAEWLQHHVVKGYTFLGISATDEKGENNHSPEEIRKVSELIGQAEKAAPGKPVFVMTHCPPASTMAASEWHEDKTKVWDWRYDHIRKMLTGHKQVFSISGHTHLPLQDERALWQGEFTALNAGGLYKVSMTSPGKNSNNYISADNVSGRAFCYIEVFKKHMLIYRYDALTLREINPANRWRIDLPYDPAKAVYTDKRAENSVAPEFPANAKAEIIRKNNAYYLVLDPAKHPDFVYSYKVKLSYNRKQQQEQIFELASEFFYADRSKRPALPFPKKLKLIPGAKGTMEITPFETFGKAGKKLSVKFIVPE